jgi:chromosomal replication initiator protein
VLCAVATAFGVSVADLIGPRRPQQLAQARQAAMWLLWRAEPRWSLVAIGHELGGRNYTTVMHGVAAADRRRRIDPRYAALLQTARNEVSR